MNENLIVEDNTIYEIDPECLKKKRKCQGETGEKVETENTNNKKCNLTFCRYNTDRECTNDDKRKECAEVSRKVL